VPTPADFIRAQKRLLEDLFEKETLEDARGRHPAAVRWQMCVKLLQQGGVIRWPTQKDELPLIGAMMLDASTFIKVSGGSLQAFGLGDLSGYGVSRGSAAIIRGLRMSSFVTPQTQGRA
jgi:hypothetical protein